MQQLLQTAVNRLLFAERRFLADLKIILTFRESLLISQLLPAHEINLLFINFDELLSLHTDLVEILEGGKNVPATISANIYRFRAYQVFCGGHPTAQKIWASRVTESRVATWEAGFKERYCGNGLSEYLKKPVLYFQNYSSLLKDVADRFEHGSSEYCDLSGAVAKLNAIAQEIKSQETIGLNVISSQTQNYVQRIKELPVQFQTPRPTRTFIAEWALMGCHGHFSDTLKWKPSICAQMVLVVFSDAILICKKQKKEKLLFVKSVEFHMAQVVQTLSEHPYHARSFLLELPSERVQGLTNMFFAEDEAKQKNIVRTLKSQISAEKMARSKAPQTPDGAVSPRKITESGGEPMVSPRTKAISIPKVNPNLNSEHRSSDVNKVPPPRTGTAPINVKPLPISHTKTLERERANTTGGKDNVVRQGATPDSPLLSPTAQHPAGTPPNSARVPGINTSVSRSSENQSSTDQEEENRALESHRATLMRISEHFPRPSVNRPSRFGSDMADDKDDDESIYAIPPDLFSEFGLAKDNGHLLNDIVAAFTGNISLYALHAFLCAYRRTTTGVNLAQILVGLFRQGKTSKRKNIIFIFQFWYQNYFEDFEIDLQAIIALVTSLKQVPGDPSITPLLQDLLETTFHQQPKIWTTMSINANYFKDFEADSTFSWMKVPPVEFAKQLCLFTESIWTDLKAKDILNYKSNSTSPQKETMNRLTSHFNAISYWVKTAILVEADLKARRRVIDRFIQIVAFILEFRNYYLVFSIMAGLLASSIRRLKNTWAEQPLTEKPIWQALQDVIDPSSGFKAYRAAVDDCKLQQISCLPYLGIHLTDIVHINDGMPDQIDNKINFLKHITLGKSIYDLLHSKSEPFNFPPKKQILYFIFQLPTEGSNSDQALDDLSLVLEPRAPANPNQAQKGEEEVVELSGTLSEISERLCAASWNGEIKEVKKMLRDPRAGQFVNLNNSRGQSALYCASRAGHANVVVALLNLPGIDINLQALGHAGTALHAACHAPHEEIVALLLCRGANEKILNAVSMSVRQEARGNAIDAFQLWDTGGTKKLIEKFPRITQLKTVVPGPQKNTDRAGVGGTRKPFMNISRGRKIEKAPIPIFDDKARNEPSTRDFTEWNVDDTNNWINKLGLSDIVAAKLMKQELTGSDLPEITSANLSAWGIPGGPQIKVMKAIQSLKSETIVSPLTDPTAALLQNITNMFDTYIQHLNSTFQLIGGGQDKIAGVIDRLSELLVEDFQRMKGEIALSLTIIAQQILKVKEFQHLLRAVEQEVVSCEGLIAPFRPEEQYHFEISYTEPEPSQEWMIKYNSGGGYESATESSHESSLHESSTEETANTNHLPRNNSFLGRSRSRGAASSGSPVRAVPAAGVGGGAGAGGVGGTPVGGGGSTPERSISASRLRPFNVEKPPGHRTSAGAAVVPLRRPTPQRTNSFGKTVSNPNTSSSGTDNL